MELMVFFSSFIPSLDQRYPIVRKIHPGGESSVLFLQNDILSLSCLPGQGEHFIVKVTKTGLRQLRPQ